MLVVILVSSILMLALYTFALAGISGGNKAYNQTVVMSNTQTAVETIARNIRSAKSVEANNSQPDANAPGAPGNLYSWSGVAGINTPIILAIPSRDASGNLIYIDGLHNSLYTDDVVYYLDSGAHNLYKRTIANQAAPGNVAKTTCPPALATAACPADASVVEDIARLNSNYVGADGASVSLPSGTESVAFTIMETKMIGTQSISASFSTTTTLRNK